MYFLFTGRCAYNRGGGLKAAVYGICISYKWRTVKRTCMLTLGIKGLTDRVLTQTINLLRSLPRMIRSVEFLINL